MWELPRLGTVSEPQPAIRCNVGVYSQSLLAHPHGLTLWSNAGYLTVVFSQSYHKPFSRLPIPNDLHYSASTLRGSELGEWWNSRVIGRGRLKFFNTRRSVKACSFTCILQGQGLEVRFKVHRHWSHLEGLLSLPIPFALSSNPDALRLPLPSTRLPWLSLEPLPLPVLSSVHSLCNASFCCMS